MCDNSDVREVDKGPNVSSDDSAAECLGGGGDDQVVRASWAALGADMRQEDRVRLCHFEVVVEDRDARHEVVDVRGARGAGSASCTQGARSQLGDGNGSDGDVVVVSDERLEIWLVRSASIRKVVSSRSRLNDVHRSRGPRE